MKKSLLLLSAITCLLFLQTDVFAQGVDCSSATSVTAPGVFTAPALVGTGADDICALGTDGTAAVWYTFNPAVSGIYTISSCFPGQTVDTRVTVSEGPCGAQTCVDGDDDGGDGFPTCGTGFSSEVNVNLTAGNTYFIQWDDRWSALGFDWSISDVIEPPSNDECDAAEVMTIPSVAIGSTDLASDSNPPVCENAGDGSGGGVWFEIVGNGDSLEVTTCNVGSSFDTQLALYEGTCDGLVCIEGNDDASNDGFFCSVSGLRSIIQWLSVPGTTYYVYLDGFGAGTGNFELELNSLWTAPPPPPPPEAVPTMSEWGLILLSLILLSLGSVFVMRRKAVLAGTGTSVSQSRVPFNKRVYPGVLLATLAGVVAIFAIAIAAFGYELTGADIPGALLATPILAYLIHLYFEKK